MALLAVSCATTAPRVERRVGRAPWRLAPSELGSQRLLRARIASPDGRGRFRLLVRLADERRFQIRATHPLFNRRLWSLDVSDGEALLVDYQQHLVCRYSGEAELAALPIGAFPFTRLPALLLGYLPAAPRADERAAPVTGPFTYEDREGRVWKVVMRDRLPIAWSVSRDGEEVASWSWSDGWAELIAPDEQIDLRWRATVRESLAGPIPPINVPPRYAEGTCDLGWLEAVDDEPWPED